MRRLQDGFEGLAIFSAIPQVDDAVYFGFANELSYHILSLKLDCDPAGGAGIDPTLPPYMWEASTGDAEMRWAPCELESDTTRGLNSPGVIQLHLPRMGRLLANEQSLYWVRTRVIDHAGPNMPEGMRPYRVSPRLRRVEAETWGGTTPATHAQVIREEVLGRSDGAPGQRYELQMKPVLDRSPGEHVVVLSDGQRQHWTEVHDFADSRAVDRYYTLDSVTGEIRFGPAIRQPDGTMKLFGAIAPRFSTVIMSRYRYGGSQLGNVQAGVLNTLKTAIPYIDRVVNRRDAVGGLDAESLEAAMMRAPALLRSRERAVTESDFEFLTREAMRADVGRVKCLQPRPSAAGRVVPGQIYVLVVPRVLRPEGFLEPGQLELPEETRLQLTDYLDERRLLTSRLNVRTPAYRWVSVHVRLRAQPGIETARVEREVLRVLYRYLNPLVGGPDGTGWPFGRDLFVSDVYQSLQEAPFVQFIRNVEMRAARPGGAGTGNPLDTLEVVAHGVIASGIHEVEFV
jgi:predicted phage baseplate assembly protein